MKKKIFFAVLAIFILLVITSDKKEQPAGRDADTGEPARQAKALPRGNRILAIDVTEGAKGGYDAAFALAKAADIGQVGLYFNWRDLEQQPGQFDNTYLDIARQYYPAKQVKLDLTITPINTNQLVVPADLAETRFDDPQMAERYLALIDHVIAKIGAHNISSLVLASEADVYLAAHQSDWPVFAQFYSRVVDRLHAKYPGLKVSFESTFAGAVGPDREEIRALNKKSDVIGLSYYPLEGGFNVQDPDTVSADLARIIGLYPDQPIWFYQFGYPSSKNNGSSEDKQAEFIRQSFSAWDRYQHQVQMIDFTWLYDYSPAKTKETARFYGLGGYKFSSFIGSLGLIEYAGDHKKAYQVLLDEAAARGW